MKLYVYVLVYCSLALGAVVLANLRSGHLRFCCSWLVAKQVVQTCDERVRQILKIPPENTVYPYVH